MCLKPRSFDESATQQTAHTTELVPRWTARLKIGNNTRFLRDYPSTPCTLWKQFRCRIVDMGSSAGINLAAI